ncbi:endonuclease/exonuclease/phosphatase family protein [Bacteroides sp.]
MMMFKKIYISAFTLMVLFCSCGTEENAPGESGNGGNGSEGNTEVTIRMMTYNVKHCSPYIPGIAEPDIDIQATANVIKSGEPDIVFIQEIDRNTKRSNGVDQVMELAKLSGFANFYFSKGQDYQGGEYGDAIFSKYPLRNTATYDLPRIEIEGTYVGYCTLGRATVTVEGRTLTIANTHLATTQENRDVQIPFINETLQNSKYPVILGGDMNATPYNSTIQTLDGYGFVRSGKGLNLFTIPSIEPTKELDYICFRPADKFEVAEHKVITGTNASDHLPVVSILKLK